MLFCFSLNLNYPTSLFISNPNFVSFPFLPLTITVSLAQLFSSFLPRAYLNFINIVNGGLWKVME